MSQSVTPSTRRQRRGGVVSPYDFTAPARLARDQARLLEVSLDTFARQWANQLSSRLKCQSVVSFLSMEQPTYDDFVTSHVEPAVFIVFSADDFGTGVLTLPVTFALDHLDHALGGNGGDQPARVLTDIELSITLTMAERALAATKYAFASFLPIDFSVDALKQDPQLLQVGRANDIVLVSKLTIALESTSHEVSLMFPLGPMQERLAKATQPEEVLSAEESRRRKAAAEKLHASLPLVPVDVSLRLKPVAVPPQQVLDLQIGDLIRMPHPKNRPLEIATSDQVVAHGVPTTAGRRRALLVTSTEDPQH